MVSRAPEPTESNPPEPAPAARDPRPTWALRDWLAAAALFAATAAVVLWQNAHVAVLFDLSYILNTAERIALGQVPYRDFPLAHAPLTFLIQAAIIRLTGRVFFHHVLYVAITGGLGTVLAWRIALTSLRGRVTAAWTLALAPRRAAHFPGRLLHRSHARVRLRLRLLAAGRDLGVHAT